MSQLASPLLNLIQAQQKSLIHLVNVRIVLVEPQFSGNLGSVARAMENAGMSDLVLVNPTAKLDSDSRSMAANAQETLKNARHVDNFAAAVADIQWTVAFTGCPEKSWREHRPYEQLVPEIVEQARQGQRLALVFGREDWGLDQATLDHCRYITRLPAHPNYPSYNLAQAVLLATHELLKHSLKIPAASPVTNDVGILPTSFYEAEPEAGVADREGMYADIEATLREIDLIYDDDIAPVIMRHVRRILEKSQLKKSESRFLRGICRKLRWYDRRQKS